MFKRKTVKPTVHFRDGGEGFSTQYTTIPLKEKKIVELLREEYKRYGSLIIDYVSEDGEVHLSTTRSIQNDEQEARLGEISEVIRDYVKNRAIPMTAHAVFLDNQLKGVFGREIYAQLKQKNLISDGADPDSVTVKPVEINSFKDFE